MGGTTCNRTRRRVQWKIVISPLQFFFLFFWFFFFYYYSTTFFSYQLIFLFSIISIYFIGFLINIFLLLFCNSYSSLLSLPIFSFSLIFLYQVLIFLYQVLFFFSQVLFFLFLHLCFLFLFRLIVLAFALFFHRSKFIGYPVGDVQSTLSLFKDMGSMVYAYIKIIGQQRSLEVK